MNKDNGIIGEMDEEDAKKLEKMFAKGQAEHLIPVPNGKLDAINAMGVAERMKWARDHRPSLEQMVAAGAELSPTQRKAYEKQERKRKQKLASQQPWCDECKRAKCECDHRRDNRK